jgi:ubiquinone/menaquinone biosynthesis C-methylase UbiE/DNA-binding MarR family transcriptional regulator
MRTRKIQATRDIQADRLREIIRALVRRFSLAERADISCCGMTVAQAATLDALRDGGMRLSDLGRRLGIAPSTLTRNLSRLEERGLISKGPDPIDGRAQRVALTEAGINAAKDVDRQERVFACSVLDRLPTGSATDAMLSLENLLSAVREATETCCPGAYDYLFSPTDNTSREESMSDKTNPVDGAADGDESIVSKVRERYGAFATAGTSCCGPSQARSCCTGSNDVAVSLGYDTVDLDLLPEGANLGLGCGAPLRHLDLKAGETVVDLGSGAGIDALIAARKVGTEGSVIGIDMTPEMLATARQNAEAAGAEQVEFREGRLESLPLDDASVDAVTSNCVINLVPDKSRVFKEISRILRPGGRLVVSDIVLDGPLPEAIRRNVLAYVGCVAGAELRKNYFEMLEEAGLGEVEVLDDVDFLDMTEKASPAEVISIMEHNGIDRKEVAGIVRSVTYRALKR